MSHEPRDLTHADQIDLICDRFEEAWRNGETPLIEDFVKECDEQCREDLLIELLLVDREFRVRSGESAPREEYQLRFPEYESIIEDLEFATIVERCRTRRGGRTQPNAVAAGDRIAQFELLEVLGEGASGTVWKAHDLRLKRIVAIKLPRRELSVGEERERFRRESLAAAQLQHPNIVTVYDAFAESGHTFIVAEFVAGVDLKQWLTVHSLSAHEAAKLASQLSDAVHHAHEQGIIHRDLKPANVLIDEDGKPHITDFGLAKWVSDIVEMTVEGNILGTPAYMAPEQARGDVSLIGRRSDVYGLGALFYELLTRQPPFQGNVASIVHQVIHCEPLPLRKIEPRVPRDLETICLKAMNKDPARRYSTAQEMAMDLRRYLLGESIHARPANMFQESWRWVSRRKVLTSMVASAVVAVSSLAAVNDLSRRNRELLGLRTVTVSTDPLNAKVAFIPLHPATGEPVQTEVTFAYQKRGMSHQFNLKPGDYLVVAAMGDGRFHEVYRRVPEPTEGPVPSTNYGYWEEKASGYIEVRPIKIPPLDVTEHMVYVPGDPKFAVGGSEATQHLIPVRPFFVDRTEFSNADYWSASEIPPGKRQTPPEYACIADFDEATTFAEDAGKRLPTEFEYEFVTTAGGTIASGDWQSLIEEELQFGSCNASTWDAIDTGYGQTVCRLRSNVAEWTSSWPASMTGNLSVNQFRVVRGGNHNTIGGDPSVSVGSRDPRQRIIVVRQTKECGLGFRCYRSAKPILRYDQFA
ncbi:protein kinase domain-containing protein [Aeoliella sp.]|uniref:protein kinase domain-containing protein n=1 Tax=Aeoliella sp. TaxID=2795800 RepID=UPI003CCB8257